jgi:hypothetical protein
VSISRSSTQKALNRKVGLGGEEIRFPALACLGEGLAEKIVAGPTGSSSVTRVTVCCDLAGRLSSIGRAGADCVTRIGPNNQRRPRAGGRRAFLTPSRVSFRSVKRNAERIVVSGLGAVKPKTGRIASVFRFP